MNKIFDNLSINRRNLLIGAGWVTAASATAGVLAACSDSGKPNFESLPSSNYHGSTVDGLHLQFGKDSSNTVVVSWHTLDEIKNPKVFLGNKEGKFEHTFKADTRMYVDHKSSKAVYAHHAVLNDLKPETSYLYAAVHDDATPEFGFFTTNPKGRSKIHFTSFGDQGTPTIGKLVKVDPVTFFQTWTNDNLGSPSAGDTTAGVEKIAPMFHLFNGDLCYANLAEDRVRTWWDFWGNNTRSARNRPWMPCAGNHENELGNGPIGYQAYQTFFEVPAESGQTNVTKGLWYSFTAGSVRVISLANDDIAYQDGGSSYVRGYSDGAQKKWLEMELKSARDDKNIDWIVVCMHQVAISSADFNGADLGVRQEWIPLFDQYGVDLVVCGHEHHYERSLPIKGQQKNQTLTPIVQGKDQKVIDTTKGTVHMVIGGGGTSAPSNKVLYNPPKCKVIVSVGAPNPETKKRPSNFEYEPAPWASVRDASNSYGFASFEVDPGDKAGGNTTMKVTYYNVLGLEGHLTPFDEFTLTRPRTDKA